jgi:DNA polymerase III epsilon subunit-like protein
MNDIRHSNTSWDTSNIPHDGPSTHDLGRGGGGPRIAADSVITLHDGRQKILQTDSTQPEPFIAIDTETGGFDASECAILSIAAVPSWDADPFHVYIQPHGKIEKKAAAVNGYTPERWAAHNALPPKHAAIHFQKWLFSLNRTRYTLAAHSAGHDALFILAFQHRTGFDLSLPGLWQCTKIKLEALRDDGTLPPGRNTLDALGDLTGYWNLDPRTSAHDALQDARCVRHSLPWLLNQKKERPPSP